MCTYGSKMGEREHFYTGGGDVNYAASVEEKYRVLK